MEPLGQTDSCLYSALPRFFYASSACIYPEFLQLNTEVEGGGLKESLAWPAQARVLRGDNAF